MVLCLFLFNSVGHFIGIDVVHWMVWVLHSWVLLLVISLRVCCLLLGAWFMIGLCWVEGLLVVGFCWLVLFCICITWIPGVLL